MGPSVEFDGSLTCATAEAPRGLWTFTGRKRFVGGRSQGLLPRVNQVWAVSNSLLPNQLGVLDLHDEARDTGAATMKGRARSGTFSGSRNRKDLVH